MDHDLHSYIWNNIQINVRTAAHIPHTNHFFFFYLFDGRNLLCHAIIQLGSALCLCVKRKKPTKPLNGIAPKSTRTGLHTSLGFKKKTVPIIFHLNHVGDRRRRKKNMLKINMGPKDVRKSKKKIEKREQIIPYTSIRDQNVFVIVVVVSARSKSRTFFPPHQYHGLNSIPFCMECWARLFLRVYFYFFRCYGIPNLSWMITMLF